MTTPAPYTPDTIAKLRRMAANCDLYQITRSLGWDRALVLSVARKHQIPLAGSVSVESPILNQGEGSASVTNHRSGEVGSHAGIAWNRNTRELARHGIVTTLTGAQSELFEPLYRALCGGDPNRYVGGEALARGTQTPWEVARTLRRRLIPLRIKLEGNKGPGGGYRLVVED